MSTGRGHQLTASVSTLRGSCDLGSAEILGQGLVVIGPSKCPHTKTISELQSASFRGVLRAALRPWSNDKTDYLSHSIPNLSMILKRSVPSMLEIRF